MPDRSRPPAAQQPQPFLLPKARRLHLSNGIPLHIIGVGNLPTVKIEFIFRAGAWFEKLSGSSFFTIKMLAEGTKNDSSSELATYFEERGAFLEMHSGPDYCTLELMAVDRHLEDLLPEDVRNDPHSQLS